jgi:hypothetical protein
MPIPERLATAIQNLQRVEKDLWLLQNALADKILSADPLSLQAQSIARTGSTALTGMMEAKILTYAGKSAEVSAVLRALDGVTRYFETRKPWPDAGQWLEIFMADENLPEGLSPRDAEAEVAEIGPQAARMASWLYQMKMGEGQTLPHKLTEIENIYALNVRFYSGDVLDLTSSIRNMDGSF